MPEPPVRVCYVISHFHPFASGAERQALAQGVELVRRGHSAHVVTQAIRGLPRDEDMRGVRVHRWVEPIRLGPLFAVSFVAGVIRALRRLRPEYDLIHTHQGLWEAISTGLGRGAFGDAPILVQPASSGYYGEAEELARTRGFPLLRRAILRNRAFAAISADIERQWLALGVSPGRMVRMASGVDTGPLPPRRRHRRRRVRPPASPSRDLHGPDSPPEEPRRPPPGLARGRPPDGGLADPGRPGPGA